ncbi:hypothetical protein [Testudinibacter sp. TR-2022]|uniref:hypothetical protein n=1 Tax=Testudinibacter sp. TR-2022 TaxID=2585029 RepID=UPI00111B27F0|nr:hypothetical protein [Testudinibacter sp. TR-2022]TNH20984.1 hypothetical protein FHQ29_11070 [Testudinibacter sp. TR-2022]
MLLKVGANPNIPNKDNFIPLRGGARRTALHSIAGGNTDWYNRQLHPSELDWIRNNAEAFAKEQGISVAEAEQRLLERAAQRVDYAWSKMIDSQDGG